MKNPTYHPEYKRLARITPKGQQRYEYYVPELNKWCTSCTIRRALQSVNMHEQDYYDKYLLYDDAAKHCKYCGAAIAYIGIRYGYFNNVCKCCRAKHAFDDPEYVKRWTASMSKVWRDETRCKNVSIGTRKAMVAVVNDPTFSQRVTAGLNRRYAEDPDFKSRVSAGLRRKYKEDPSFAMHVAAGVARAMQNGKMQNCGKGKRALVLVQQCVKCHSIAMPTQLHTRSSYETHFVLTLERLGIQYEYETVAVPYNGHHKYIVDFYLPTYGLLIEIKPCAYAFCDAVRKKSTAAVQYAKQHGLKFYVFTENELFVTDDVMQSTLQQLSAVV